MTDQIGVFDVTIIVLGGDSGVKTEKHTFLTRKKVLELLPALDGLIPEDDTMCFKADITIGETAIFIEPS